LFHDDLLASLGAFIPTIYKRRVAIDRIFSAFSKEIVVSAYDEPNGAAALPVGN